MYKFPTQEGAASSAPTNAREIILLQSLRSLRLAGRGGWGVRADRIPTPFSAPNFNYGGLRNSRRGLQSHVAVSHSILCKFVKADRREL